MCSDIRQTGDTEAIVQQDLAKLLGSYMKRASMGDTRLANQVNSIADNDCFIHRSTIRNWRVGSAHKVSNWRQLATIAVALGLNEFEANRLLESGRCPSISSLKVTAREIDRALLAYWQNPGKRPEELSSVTRDVSDDSPLLSVKEQKRRKTFIPSGTQLWMIVGVATLTFAGLAVVKMLASYYLQSASSKNLLVNSDFEDGEIGWITYVNDSALASFEVIDGAMHIQIEQTPDKSWHIALNQKDLEVTAGKTYTVRFRVIGDGVTSMNVDITRVIDPKTTLSFDNSVRQKVTTTDYWNTKTIEFKAIETISLRDGGARLFFKFGKSKQGWILLDDIEFFEGKIEQNTGR
ncbi:carbohydrate binding domain-containing protein [bacterium]|nr:carbohydrate binding domain-containing protein [bacterium]